MAWNEDREGCGAAVSMFAVLRLSWSAAACLSLGACTVMMSRESPLNEVTKDAPTALEVYRSGPASGVSPVPGPSGPSGAADAQGATAARMALHVSSQARLAASGDARQSTYWSALEPMRQRFARLPNPDLVMVVYPHLAQGRYPVPGYVTTFPMYEEIHYVLPGELQGELQRADTTRAVAREVARVSASQALSSPALRSTKASAGRAVITPRGDLSDGGMP